MMSVELGGRQIRLCDCFAIRDDSVLTLHPDTGQIESISLAPATQPERAAIQAATAAPFGAEAAAEAGRKVKCQVLINPVSGSGKGLEIWASVKPFVQQCDHLVQFEVTETQRAGHAWTIGNEVDLSTVDAFIIVGGDGLMHEFV